MASRDIDKPNILFVLSDDQGAWSAADRIRGLRDELEAWFAKYVIPAMDGSKLPVTGYGQRDLATQDNAFQYRARN